MNIVLVGNGAVSLMIAREICLKIPRARITIVAPRLRPGCASVAAAAMLNSFAEIDTHTLSSPHERHKWLLNKSATAYWPNLLEELSADTNTHISSGFGTFVINNAVTDCSEDHNYRAIVNALLEYGEPHECIDPKSIPGYLPSAPSRALGGVFIPREGWVNPLHLLEALERFLSSRDNCVFVDSSCHSISVSPSGNIDACVISDGSRIEGDFFILAPGASFSRIIEASELTSSFMKIFYGIGASLVLETGDKTLANCVRTPNRGFACGIYAAPRDSTHTIVGASSLVSPVPRSSGELGSVYTLLKGAMEQINHHMYNARLDTINIGWRPVSSDTLPLLGQSAFPNLLVATGTKRDGFHCSPLIASCIVDLLLEKKPAFDITLFDPSREPVAVLTRAQSVELFVRHSMNENYQHDFVAPKNAMLSDLAELYRAQIESLHDLVGAVDWGIPLDLVNMYKYGHIGKVLLD